MGLQARNRCDIFPLIALDTLDGDLSLSFGFRGLGFGGSGFGFFLLRVLGGTFLGVDGEGGEDGCYGFWKSK